MIGLSQDLRKKVQDGEINIDLLDEDTKSKVEAYQEWYDKIHECESELEKLKKKEKEVDQQKLDNITDRFDELKKVYSTSSSVIESRLKYREENGESQAPGSKYYKDVNSHVSKYILSRSHHIRREELLPVFFLTTTWMKEWLLI